jgi:hypothetical protein
MSNVSMDGGLVRFTNNSHNDRVLEINSTVSSANGKLFKHISIIQELLVSFSLSNCLEPRKGFA